MRNRLFYTTAVAVALALVLAWLLVREVGRRRPAERSMPAVQPGPVRAFHMLSGTEGWVLTHSRVLLTSDGGRRWADVTPAGLSLLPQRAVFFVDGSHGWVAGADTPVFGPWTARVFRTVDGGRTWQPATLGLSRPPAFGYESVALDFLDRRHGWLALGLGGNANFDYGAELFHTQDGGATWTQVSPVPASFGFEFVNPDDGWAVGGPAVQSLYRTKDGGRSWHRVRLPPAPLRRKPLQTLLGLPEFFSPQEGVLEACFIVRGPMEVVTLTGLKGPSERNYVVFYRTADGGNSWEPTTPLTGPDFRDQVVLVTAATPDASTWVLAPRELLHVTSDAGRSWHTIEPTTALVTPSSFVDQLQFLSPQVGWALSCHSAAFGGCEPGGAMFSTTDGGHIWRQVNRSYSFSRRRGGATGCRSTAHPPAPRAAPDLHREGALEEGLLLPLAPQGRGRTRRAGAGQDGPQPFASPHLSTSVSHTLPSALLALPTAHTSPKGPLPTAENPFHPASAFGLGTRLHPVPSQWSRRVFDPDTPTAQTSFAECAATPDSDPAPALGDLGGPETRCQCCPSQCSIRGRSGVYPTAHASVAEGAVTPVR